MLKDIQRIQNKVENIWNYTEMDLDDFSSVGLRKFLESISDIVNDVTTDLEEIKKKTSVKLCSICDSQACEDCLDDMEKQFNAPSCN
tara:strand:- start:1751 stop:2011 length:261 start_codon:yes stop_codon:yes gene_type:complete